MGKHTQLDFDFNYDFKLVEDIVIQEELTQEEIEDGITPFEMDVKVCFTSHAYDRIYNTYGRQCEKEAVLDLIREKGHKLFDLKSGEEFAILNESKTLGLVCKLYQYEDILVLVLPTIIRNVVVGKDYKEYEKKVYITRNTKCV